MNLKNIFLIILREILCFKVCENVVNVSCSGVTISRVQNQIQTFDSQTPVFYYAIRQRSEDLKHVIPSTYGLGHRSVTEGGGGLKKFKICVTSFMNSP